MSRLRPFLIALMLASMPATDGSAIAKRQLVGLRPVSAPLPARPTLTNLTTTSSAAQLPNGASSIKETYGDWAVECRLIDGQKKCHLFQVYVDGKTNQQVFGIEIEIPADGKVDVTILMPFRVKLAAGAVLKLDDKDFGGELRFVTCVPAGCLLPVSFSMTGVDAMKNGKMLTVASRNLSNEIIGFNAPLDGFATAIARLVELGEWKPSKEEVGD